MNRFGWRSLFLLILLVGAIAAVACTSEGASPTPTSTTPATVPELDESTAPATTTSGTAPTPAETLQQTPATTLITTPTPTEEPAPATTTPTDAPEPSLVRVETPPAPVVSVRRVEPVRAVTPPPVGPRIAPISFTNGSRPVSFGQQQLSAAGGLTVSVSGSVTVTADEVYVVVIPEQFYGRSGPEPLSSEDRAEVIEKLAAVGVAEDDIEFDASNRYGPITVSVEVEVSELPEIGDVILAAVEDALRRIEHSGVRFSLSEETCDGALALARRVAVEQAEKSVDDLADALAVSRGGVIGAIEYPLSGFDPYSPASSDIR